MIIRGSYSCSMLLLFSTLFLCSCITTDKTLGDRLLPTDQDLTLCFETFDLPIESRPTDSLQTYNSLIAYETDMTLLFGSCQDPVFGLTKAGAAFQFFPWSNYSYGDNPEPVSLTLILYKNQDNIVLDQSQTAIPQTIFVHEVTTDLSFNAAYNNSLQPNDWDPVPISQPGQIYFGGDTVRISLSLDFARKLLAVTQEERDSTSLFLQRFKGLYIQTETPGNGINTGRINRASYYSAQLTLKYQLDGADSTLSYSPYTYGIAFNTITHTNTSIDPVSSKNIYYQGLAGHKPYIDFVALTHNIQEWAKQSQIGMDQLLISRAEILLSYDPAIDYTIINQYPLLLYPYTHTYTDTTSNYQIIDNIYLAPPDGNTNINRSKFYYSINITYYLQSLLKKETVTEQDNTWLMETASTVIDSYSGTSIYHFSSDTYPLALFQGSSSDAKPILKLTYAVLK